MEFLSHFCTFFNFNICYSMKEAKAVKKKMAFTNDIEEFNKKVDDWMRSFDDIK
jgi:hypothetical protein